MTSINQLKKQIAREKKKEAKRDNLQEKSKLKKELFNLKHSRKISVVKSIGNTIKIASGNLTENVSNVAGSFQNQRKKKKGIGGYLQRIADNQ